MSFSNLSLYLFYLPFSVFMDLFLNEINLLIDRGLDLPVRLTVCNLKFCSLAVSDKRLKMELVFTYIKESAGQLLLVFGAIFLTSYLIFRRYNVGDSGRKLPPALPSLPVVGSLPFLPTNMKDLAELSISPRNKLGKIFSLYLGSK